MVSTLDSYAYELLAHPPPPGFDQFVGSGGATNAEVTTEQMDDYFRAVGILPPRPEPQPAADVPPSRDATYDADIDASLRAMEKDDAMERPSPDYLASRIHPVARVTLVQWMVEFSRLYFLDEPCILHRAVSYVDRYLSARALPDGNHKYQLSVLGAVALLTAAKFEEPSAARDLSAGDITCWCGYDTTLREVLDAEQDMVAALGYRLGGPTADTFVSHFTRGLDLELQHVAHDIADASLFDHQCLELLPSGVAAAAIFLAKLALEPSHDSEQVRRWGRELEAMTGYKPADVRDVVESIYGLLHAPGFVIVPAFFADS